MWMMIGLTLLIVSIVSFLFLCNFLAILIMIFVDCCTVFEIYGFAYWFGLQVNGVLVLNMLLACALSVEFNANLCRHFLISKGNNKERNNEE